MSYQGFDITYKEFKEKFYAKIGDGTCLDVLDINLLKVVLDGLKVKYNDRGKITDYLARPLFIVFLYYFLKVIFDLVKSNKLQKRKKRLLGLKYVSAFADRIHNYNGKSYSYYYQNIYEHYGREKFCYIKKNQESPLEADIQYSELIYDIRVFSLSNIKLIIALKKHLRFLKGSKNWESDELKNISIAYFLFLNEYLKYNSFFKRMNFERAIIECHYHEEGFILACKKNNIKVIELQHGLISKEDIFFVFPSQVSACTPKALFADHILVYGAYWRNVLLGGSEYKNEQIGIIGYYPFDKEEKIFIKNNNKKRILITTQYSISIYYINYVKWLSSVIDSNWEIVVKTHPSESKQLYNELLSLNNVVITDDNLNSLIDASEFTISIFSTTLFDTVRKGKVAFALNIEFFKDYVLDVVSTNAIFKLEVNENPIEKFKSIDMSSNKTVNSFLYAEFDPRVCLDKLMNA